MRIAIFAPLLGIEATGQSRAVANTASHLSAAGHQVTVLATDCGYQGRPVREFVAMSSEVLVHVFPSYGFLNRRLYRSPGLEQWVAAHIEDFDVVDIQGVWSLSGIAVARIFHANRKPYVLTPHGTMTRYDWRKSPLRRRLFFALGFGKVWGQADAVRFLSRGEATTSYHAARGLVAIIPNGIDIESSPTQSLRDSARSTLGIPSSASVLLFLGRITHQKGVKEALAAFELAAKSLPDLFFLLVGPSEGNYGREVNSFIEQSPVRNRILAPGVVTGNAKTTCFRAADAFISLSHNEGMSLALLEALSYSLPLVLTQASNLDRLAEYDAGIFTSHEPEAAATAILRIMQDPSFRQSASHQAKRLAQEVFAWAIVIPQLVAMYQDRIDNKNKI